MANVNVRYTGSADAYELTAADLKRHGVEGFSKTVWTRSDPVQSISEEALAKLVELEMPFRQADDDQDELDDDDESSGDLE